MRKFSKIFESKDTLLTKLGTSEDEIKDMCTELTDEGYEITLSSKYIGSNGHIYYVENETSKYYPCIEVELHRETANKDEYGSRSDRKDQFSDVRNWNGGVYYEGNVKILKSVYELCYRFESTFSNDDLTFTEYMQNVNPDSHKFGQLFNMELLNIFDKSIQGWSYSNISLDNLKNNGYKKTNLFSLNYRITDKEGNFIDAYSQNEVQIKLNGLKRWLTENLIPIGAKITDINGKYTQPIDWIIKHDTYRNENKRIEEYSTPIDYDVTGYLYPITLGSDNYNISVTPKCAGNVEWYDYKVRTFNIVEWNSTYFYLAGTKLIHNNKIWESLIAVSVGDEPGVTNNWVESTLDTITNVQIFTDSKYDLTPWSFSINKITDPHFMIEVNYHSGYGCTWQTKKVYSVIPNFFNIFNNI